VEHPRASVGIASIAMKCHVLLLLSLLLGTTTAAYKLLSGDHRTIRITTIDKIPDALITVRGGGASSNKLRNVIRSLLDISEKKAPTLAKLLKRFLKTTETLTGIALLPPLTQTKKTTTTKKAKTKVKDKEKQETVTSTTPKTTRNPATAALSNKHVSQTLSSTNPNYRIQRELKEFLQHPPLNLQVKVGSNIRVWIITLKGSGIYKGEVYRLRVQFPPSYPTVPPSVYFLPPTPQHEHVYTNGDICLSLLGKGWLPSMTAQSIAVSIQSILNSAVTKSLPMDNARHSQNKPGQYQKDWVYHDDHC
jgi:ubiquitin-conjugating enzyme E2 W